MSTTYVLQLQSNPNYCIGVQAASSGSPVVLSYLQGAGSKLTQWILDPNTLLITSAAAPSLCLDVKGTVTQGSQLIITDIVLGRQSQQWNWVGNPPYISNIAASNMVIDNSGGNNSQGNPILIWGQNGGTNQQWLRTSVQFVEAATAALTTA